ncbi:hypothetical protein ACFL6Y_05745 [Elusimicrobiota bacterium]
MWTEDLVSVIKSSATALTKVAEEEDSDWPVPIITSLGGLEHRAQAVAAAESEIPNPRIHLAAMPVRAVHKLLAPPPGPRDIEAEKFRQLNALRIAIIDLNEICRGLTYNFFASFMSAGSSGDQRELLNTVILDEQIKKKMQTLHVALLSDGPGFLGNFRNGLTHYDVYAPHVVPQGVKPADEPQIYEFELTSESDTTGYFTKIFEPVTRLGQRKGAAGEGFDKISRRDLAASLCSAGRVAVDLAHAFHSKISKLATQRE